MTKELNEAMTLIRLGNKLADRAPDKDALKKASRNMKLDLAKKIEASENIEWMTIVLMALSGAAMTDPCPTTRAGAISVLDAMDEKFDAAH